MLRGESLVLILLALRCTAFLHVVVDSVAHESVSQLVKDGKY